MFNEFMKENVHLVVVMYEKDNVHKGLPNVFDL